MAETTMTDTTMPDTMPDTTMTDTAMANTVTADTPSTTSTYLPPELWTMIISFVIDSCRQDDNAQDLLSTVLALSTVSPSFHTHVLHITQKILAALQYDCTVVWNDRVRALFKDTFFSLDRYNTCTHYGADIGCGTMLAQVTAPSHPWKELYCGECLLERRVLQPRASRNAEYARRRISTDAAYLGLFTLRCLLAMRANVRDFKIKINVGDTRVEDEEGDLVVVGRRVGF